ncbi:MAG: transcriptional regulator [Candidatus Methanosuratincola verstraetei]|jgi:predicted transcriptional regulator|uniref:Helix-turn-helix domain-containing protein n=1 Tax=Candidatus Methanosuratincola petrocarbonis (ex Vanwonterghem et al. 2016) TaxID=1867261 RepID=A0A7J3V1X9_9CREN
MRPSCEVVSRYVLPVFRSMVAKDMMSKYKISQSEVASKLGVTQAAISHYLKSKRGAKMASELETIPEVKAAVAKISEELMSKKSEDDLLFDEFCGLCKIIRKNSLLWERMEAILQNR